MIAPNRDSAAERIWGLVCGYAEPKRSAKLLLMLKAFVDDSHMGSGPVYILAGWCASAKTWASFVNDWDDVLRMSPRVRHFKYSDAMSFNGEFNGMSRQSRDEKLKLLVGVIEKHKLVGIATIIPDAVYRPLFAHDMGAMRFPYIPSFFGLITRLVRHYQAQGVDEKIEFIFDYQPGGADQMGNIHREWENFLKAASEDQRKYLHNHPPSFLDDEEIVALQAADLHAGWVFALNSASSLGEMPPTQPWGDVGKNIIRLNWIMTEEVGTSIYKHFFGVTPLRFTYTFQYGMA